MLSTPPATKRSPSPARIAWAAAHHRLQSGAAEPVHRLTRHLDRQAGQQRRHAGDVPVVFARLVGAAEDDVIDPVGPESARAASSDADGGRRQVVGAQIGQGAAGPADRGADCGSDEGVAHGSKLTLTSLSQAG